MQQGGWNPPPGGPQPGYGQPQGQPQGGFGQPQQGYGPPPGAAPQQGYQPAPAPMGGGMPAMPAQLGFMAGLFDFSFTTFIATKVIKVLYGIFLLALVLGILGFIGTSIMAMVNGAILQGLGLLVVTPILAVLYLILGRMYFELIIVAFRVAENLTEINRKTKE
jgi:hypothetical protein